MKNVAKFSLLYPSNATQTASYTWGNNTIVDLDLDKIAIATNMGPQYRETIKAMLFNISADAGVIAYRQEILADLLSANGVAAGLEEVLPLLARLHDSLSMRTEAGGVPLQETLGRLSELNTYVACVKKLHAILTAAGADLRAEGLCNLRDRLQEISGDATFQSLEKNLPGLLKRLSSVPSITIGVNLDNELRPVEVTLLSVNEKPFRGGSLLQQLMGTKTVSDKPDQGIAQLHALPFVQVDQQGRTVSSGRRVDPMMVPLFKDLLKLVQAVIAPISSALKDYAQVNAHFLVSIEQEVAFYLGAMRLIKKMEAVGLPMCRPEILPLQERACNIAGLYNLRLALDMQHEKPSLHGVVIQNDVNFDANGRIFILTGPNQGGKTVYTQAMGIAQVLFQAGLYIPAETARISPTDGLYTHFAIEEKSIQGMGRLSEESKRLSDIFEVITPCSMVLFNESLSSTSAGESLYMAQDIIRALRLFGVRAIFATHLHELAEKVDVINHEVNGDSLVISMVAEVDTQSDPTNELVPRTYKIKPGPPKGHSYAKGIAVRYGISFEQLAEKWQERKPTR
jgi:hypothetical protein